MQHSSISYNNSKYTSMFWKLIYYIYKVSYLSNRKDLNIENKINIEM